MGKTKLKKVGKKILGAWELVSWVYQNEHGENINYFGNEPKGILLYDKSGYMSVQIATENRPEFESEGINAGKKKEMAAAFSTYLSYFGKYVESEPGVYEHTVEGTLFPNWLGKKEIRYARLKGDTLVLSTPPTPTKSGDIVFNITWKKIK